MPAFILVPSQRGENDIPKLTLAGALVATFYLFTGAYLTPASWSFLVYAHAIADGTRVPATAGFASRDLGFPLLALLSGYTITESIIPLTVIQAIFAILIPVFVYKSVSQFSRITAFYAGYITIISLTPYLFMKMIHHDETYMFFMMLMITLLLRYFQTSRLPYLYAFTAAALAASLTRPAGNLLLPVFLTLGYFYERKRLPHYAVSALILVTCSIYYKWQHDQFFPLQPGETLPSYTGQQVFYDPYINSTEYGIALSPDTNLSMAEISRAVLHYTDPDPSKVPLLHNNPNFPTDSPFVKKRIDDLSPRELSRQVFSIPCFQYFVLMGQAEPDDKVFMSAALDIITSHPIYTLRYTLRNFLLFLFRPGYAHPVNSPDGSCGPLTRIGTVFYPDYARIFGNPLEVAIRPVMAREVSFIPSLRPRLVGFIYSLITRAWLTYYDRLLEFASILTVSSWLIIVAALAGKIVPSPTLAWVSSRGVADRWVPSVIASSALLLYNGLVTAAFAEPDYRYSEMVFPVNVLIAGLGAAAVLRLGGFRETTTPAPLGAQGRLHSPYTIWPLLLLTIMALLGSWSLYTWAQTHS